MIAPEELAAWLRLAATSGVGAQRQRKLLAAFGLPQQIFVAGRSSIAAVVGSKGADALLGAPPTDLLERTQVWLDEDRARHHLITLADARYPSTLFDIADPPLLLYANGNPALLQRPALAIVGARTATAQGSADATAFARHLAQRGLTIVSGLANGIDAAAHEGALAAGPEAAGTIAVIGTGIDRIYPARNADLARKIAADGLIISEFPLGAAPQRHHFPRRNRLIAGLTQGVLVVEAALNSGSLITANLASEGGREVFAIPGSIHSPLSRGCHRLIRDGAKLVETAEDIVEELRGRLGHELPAGLLPSAAAPKASATAARAAPEVDDESARVLAAIGHDPVDLDTLALHCGLTVDALYAILLPLELDGRILHLPGSRIQRN